MKRKLITLSATAIMILSLALPVFAATTFSDMPNDYSKTAIENAVENGLLTGDNGLIMPDKSITRAEMAAIINRAFGATAKASLAKYNDVSSSKWYYDDMAKAVAMKTFEGDGAKLNPEDSITREEALVVIARSLKLEDAASPKKEFSDINSISSWARGPIYAMINAGYINGDGGIIRPKADMSRQDFAVVFDNVVKSYIKAAGTVTTVKPGNVMINKTGVTLKDVTVDGDVIVGDGAGSGEVVLDNVTVKGRVLVRGAAKVTITGTFNAVVLGDDVVTYAKKSNIKNGSIVGSNSILYYDQDSTLTNQVLKNGVLNSFFLPYDSKVSGGGTIVTPPNSTTGTTVSGGGGGSSSGGGSSTTNPSIALTLSPAAGTQVKVGETITASSNGLPVDVAWTVDNKLVGNGYTYKPTISDIGKTITVTATRSGYTTAVLITGVVARPAISLTINGATELVEGNTYTTTIASAKTVSAISMEFGQAIKAVGAPAIITIKGPNSIGVTTTAPFGTAVVNTSGTKIDININTILRALSTSGTFTITVPADSFEDAYGNKNAAYSFELIVTK